MRYLLITCALVTTPAPIIAQTTQEDEDKSYLTTLIEDNLSGVSRSVNISGFRGALSSEATIDRLTISDEDGVWLTLEDVVLDWNRSALLRGRIEVEQLSAVKIIVARAPISETTTPSAESQPFALPELPVSIELGTLQIDRIELGESFLGEPVNISLTGSATLEGGEGTANVTAIRLDETDGRFVIDGSYSNETTILDLTLDVSEAAGGIAAKQLDIPDQPALALTVAGDGPLDSFAADIALATDGVDRIAGQFALETIDDNQAFQLNIGGDLTPLLEGDYHDFFGDDVDLVAAGRQLPDGRFDLSDLDLTAQRLQLTGGALIGAEGWPERLNLRGQINDPTGDVVLLPLAGPKTFVDDVSLNVQYDQAVSDDWTASFVINGYDRPGLYISEIDLSGGGILQAGEGADQTGRVTADFTYAASGLELDDPGTAQAFGDAVTGTILANKVEDEPFIIEELTLRGPGLEADANAQIGTSSEAIRITATSALRVSALGRFSTLAGRDLGGAANVDINADVDLLNDLYDITAAGTTTDLAVDVPQADPLLAGDGDISVAFVRDPDGTRLETFEITTAAAQITADADLTSDGSDARFQAQIADISLVEPSLSGPVTLGGTVSQDAEKVVTFDITGDGPDVTLQAKGNAQPLETGYNVLANVAADIADLDTYAALAGRPLDGAIDAQLSGVLLTEGLRFNGELSATTNDLVIGIDQFDPLLAGRGTVSVGLERNTETQYRARDLVLRMPQITLDADATVDTQGPLDADFNLRIADVGLVVPEISGPLTAIGTASRDTDGVAIVDASATAPGVNLTADVAIAPETNAISGNIQARVNDLSDYRSLIGQPVSGGVTADISGRLLPDLSELDVTLDVATRDLQTGVTQVDPLLTGEGRVQGIARRDTVGITIPALQASTPHFDLSATLSQLEQGGTGTFDLNLQDIGLVADGINGPATAKGQADQSANGDWTVDADVTAPGADINADVTIAAETNEISGALQAAINDLSAYRPLIGQPVSGGVNATVVGSVLPDLSAFSADIDVATRDLAIGNPTADLLLRGAGSLDLTAARTSNGIRISNLAASTNNVTVNGNLDANDNGNSTGQFDAQLRDIGIFTDQLSGPVTATGTASVASNGTIGLNIDGTGPGGITARADGTVASGGDLNIDVDGVVPLALANEAIAPRSVNGTATLDLSINGPASLEAVSGRVSINDARLSAPTFAQALEDISGNIGLSNGTAQLSITGNVPTGGNIAVSGPIGLTGSMQADVTANLNDVVVSDPELYETSIDGQVAIRGPLSGGANIAGTLTLGQTDVQVPSSGVGSLGDLPDVVHIGQNGRVQRTLDKAGVTLPEETTQSETSGTAFPLDITVNAPSRIFIRGRGLDAELGGSLTLGGTTANIVPVGQFSLIRGRLDILQQRFELAEGVASLQGDFSPYIRLVAETEAQTGTQIRIIVEGPADAPEVSFESTPQLPQDEVLSQLIFGRNLSEISPLQAVQLAAAVGTLAGRGGGGLIDGFRQELGLDDFDVTTDEDGNAAVRAGAYLSENVYTDVTINSEGETEINLNLDITDEITAKGTVDADGETSIGIFFERDY
ncbi:translocation/assembly module TamB domain-containing protein [Loktanella sp. F6476L]|uniref:translocation/assembly module TamB domain-containing protein n=1 Tax=Loktanella sp. F6476L TaxID=2926405 RepID=UPI001FF1A595|nr:translocation/assembly module TamB domain-containing protein [Loktanella sp. F6476L]MCK0121754.1 translocation/assembly module TamB domain-containing protein [Loktanella sp. F6476L]